MKNSKLMMLMILICSSACEDPVSTTQQGEAGSHWNGRHVQTLKTGADDNSEVIKLLPQGDLAVLVASKTRKLTLLQVDTGGLTALRSAYLLSDDITESELTHVDFDAEARFAAITRTRPTFDDGQLVACAGELLFVDISNTDTFGTVMARTEVGPMPDAVDISPDGRWVVTADEVDYNDGKCPLEGVTASITVIELEGGMVERARTRATITMVDEAEGPRREPEQISFASDSDRVAVTLQDTHELLLFSVSEVISEGETHVELDTSELSITRLPDHTTGAEPWPDGVACFKDATGQDFFVTAGEYNDTFSIFTTAGDLVTQIEIMPADMPGDLPRNIEDWSHAPFRPDSVAPFAYGGHRYLAFSLKHAGAVGVWEVDDVSHIRLASVVKVGAMETGTATTESSLGSEGISANDQGLILTANEKESSVSLIGPLLR